MTWFDRLDLPTHWLRQSAYPIIGKPLHESETDSQHSARPHLVRAGSLVQPLVAAWAEQIGQQGMHEIGCPGDSSLSSILFARIETLDKTAGGDIPD